MGTVHDKATRTRVFSFCETHAGRLCHSRAPFSGQARLKALREGVQIKTAISKFTRHDVGSLLGLRLGENSPVRPNGY
jgi:hypothetical protein